MTTRSAASISWLRTEDLPVRSLSHAVTANSLFIGDAVEMAAAVKNVVRFQGSFASRRTTLSLGSSSAMTLTVLETEIPRWMRNRASAAEFMRADSLDMYTSSDFTQTPALRRDGQLMRWRRRP